MSTPYSREYLQALSDNELRVLCYDEFPRVYGRLTQEASNKQIVDLIVDKDDQPYRASPNGDDNDIKPEEENVSPISKRSIAIGMIATIISICLCVFVVILIFNPNFSQSLGTSLDSILTGMVVSSTVDTPTFTPTKVLTLTLTSESQVRQTLIETPTALITPSPSTPLTLTNTAVSSTETPTFTSTPTPTTLPTDTSTSTPTTQLTSTPTSTSTPAPTQIPTPPLLSCSTEHIALSLYGDIYVIDVTKPDEEIKIIDSSETDLLNPTWSPDGTRIAFDDGKMVYISEISIIDPDNQTFTPVLDEPIDGGDPTWSPDGSKIAFSASGSIYRVEVGKPSSICQLTTDSHQDIYPNWSPDNPSIVFQAKGRSSFTWNNSVVSDSCNGTAIINLSGKSGNESYPAWRPNINQLAFVGGGSDYENEPGIHLIDTNDAYIGSVVTETQIPNFNSTRNKPDLIQFPSWSSYGNRLVFEIHRQSKNERELYIVNVDGTGLTLLRSWQNQKNRLHPVWRSCQQ